MAVNNEYVNRVDANGQTLIDLTNDTATAGDVLEGRTLHLASGAPATGTYRPSDEIEARLEATVGHSSKNLLEITARTRTTSGVTFTIDKQGGTITVNGTATANTQLNVQGDEKRPISTGILKNGQILTCDGIINGTDFGINYYDENGTYISTQRIDDAVSVQIVAIPTNAVSYRFFARKLPASGNTSVTLYPMLRDGSISDDTFEPYVTPTDERIEPANRAYLEATVGHSAINLFEPKYRQGTSANTTTANAVCSLTVIPTEYGKVHTFRKYNSNFSIRIYGTNDEGKAAILSGGTLTQSLRLYEGSYIYDDSWTHTNETQGVTCYVIMVRKPNFTTPETYQNITPSDIPSNLVMVTDSSISDDTFKPYVTPTDEKKQDKPVVLWEAAVGSTGVQTVALSALSQPLSNFSSMRVLISSSSGDTTISNQDVVHSYVDIDVDLSIALAQGADTGWSSALLGFHVVNGHLVFDRVFIWIVLDLYSQNPSIMLMGLQDINDTTDPPDETLIPTTFIRKIIGIP